MKAFPVIDQRDVIEDRRSCVLACGEVAVVDEFVLEAGEEALRHRVVIRTLPATHAGSDASGTQLLPVSTCAIRRTAIRVMNQPPAGSRWTSAMVSAVCVRVCPGWLSIAHPTIRREKRSRSTARCSQ